MVPREVVQEFEAALDQEADAWVEAMREAIGRETQESRLLECGGPGSGIPGPCPSAAEFESQAESEVPKTLEKAAGLQGKFKAALGAIKDKAVEIYKSLEAKHGRAGAIAILAAGHALGLATPLALIPGSTFIATAAMAGAYDLAKRGLQAAGVVKTHEAEEEQLSDEEIVTLAHQLLAQLVQDAKGVLKDA